MEIEKINIRNLSKEDLTSAMVEMGEKAFKAKQVYEWLWKKNVHTFEEMTNISLATRGKLQEKYFINHVELSEKQVSKDKTIKCAFKTYDNKVIEGVLIPTSSRTTACISSQVGCSLACKFCATGRLKRLRNLDAAEIYDQVVSIKKLANEHYDLNLSNIVWI